MTDTSDLAEKLNMAAFFLESDGADFEARDVRKAIAALEAKDAEIKRLREALDAISNSGKLVSYGDPTVLRDAARAALTTPEGEAS